MKIFVAGATGAIGRPLIKQLLQEGHDVIGMARNDEAARQLQQQGATVEIADALDANAVSGSIARTQPEVVINQVTALPKRIVQRPCARQHRWIGISVKTVEQFFSPLPRRMEFGATYSSRAPSGMNPVTA